MMTEYDGIFFDIGGVILDLASVQEGHVDFLTRLAEQEGIETVEAFIDEWQAALGTYFREREGTEYRRAKVGYQRAVDAAIGYELPESAWMPAFEAASTACLQPNPNATETIRTLDRAGLYLGIISDIDTWEAESMLAQFDTADRFDHITTSEEVGRTKPDRAIFEAALDKGTPGICARCDSEVESMPIGAVTDIGRTKAIPASPWARIAAIIPAAMAWPARTA